MTAAMESKPQIPAPRSVSGDDPASARIGPFHVVRHLVSGPGAQLLEAAREDGEQALLQIVRCRASKTDADEADRQQMLESIRSATEALDGEIPLLQHGHVEADGETIIYWALEWDERAVDLGLAKIENEDDLVSAGIHLAKRLTDLHAKNRLDPLLSERLVVIRSGEVWVAGVPVRVPDGWLSPGMRAARLAPEEVLAKTPTRAGDVWRLGQTLKALTVYLDRLPTRVWRTLELLGHPDVGVRVHSAEQALSMMESLADPYAPDPPSISDLERAQDPSRTMLDEPSPIAEAITIADKPLFGTRKLADDSKTEPGTRPAREPSDLAVVERDTLIDFTIPDDSHVDGVVVLEPGGIRDPAFTEAPTVGMPPAASDERDDGAGPIEAAIPQMRKKKRGSWDTNPRDKEKGPTGTVLGPKFPGLNRSTTLPGVRRIEPAALPRMLPPPGGLLAGPRGTLVGPGVVEPHQIMRLPRVSDPTLENEPPPSESERDTEEAAPAPAEEAETGLPVDPVPSPRTAAIAVLAFIVGLLIGAIASKALRLLEDNPGLLAPTIAIPTSNVVRLDAEPPASAIVVAEEDGRILGATPLWFQVPSNEEIALLVAAPGHEPMRVVLPSRGTLRVVLEPRKSDVESCLVNLHSPQNVPIEGVTTPIEETASGFYVPGSAVIRAVGELRGAWLLRCPELGGEGVIALPGRPLEKAVELRVSNPPDMEVSIDGNVVGTSPVRKRVENGFRLISIQSANGGRVERWVPLFGDTEIDCPYPN